MTFESRTARVRQGVPAAVLATFLLLSCRESRVDGRRDVAVVSVDPNPVSLPVGASAALFATARDSQGHPLPSRAISWSTDDGTIASVDRRGAVTGVAAGRTKVRAAAGGTVGAASITVLPAPVDKEPHVVVSPTTTYQIMRGWEATAQAGADCDPAAFALYQNELMDRATSELGINRIRLEVRSGFENSTNWDSLSTVGAITPAEWRQHRYEVVNDNADPNVINPDGFHWGTLDRSVVAVVDPLRRRLIARGERLFVNLTYVDFSHSGFKLGSAPAEYAEFVYAAFRHLQQRFGWVPDAVEVVLEPDNTTWTASQIGAGLVAAGDRLAAAGWHPDFVAPSNSSMSGAITYFDKLIQVPRTLAYLKEFSYHRYSGVSLGALQDIAVRGVQNGVRTSMLERIGADDATLRQDLTTGRVSAWQEFALAYCTPSDDGSAYYLVGLTNPAAPTLTLASRARYLAQYFRYVRMDAVRVGATSSDNALSPVAFRNADGKVVAVVKSADAATFLVYGLPPGTYGVTYTTTSATAASGPDVVVASGQPATVSVPAAGVVSVFAR